MVMKQSEGSEQVERKRPAGKRVRISSQRQITIPKEFYEIARLHDEAIVELRGTEIVIRTVPTDTVDFSTDILKDLIAKGLEGDQLLAEFERTKKLIANALHDMKQDVQAQPLVEGSLSDFIDSLPDEDESE